MTASGVHVQPNHPTLKRHGRCLKFALLAAVLLPLFTGTASGQGETEGVLVLSADFELRRYNIHGILEARPEETAAACRCLKNALTVAADEHPVLQSVSIPSLTAVEEAVVAEHTALLATIVSNIRFMEEVERDRPQGSVGPAALRERDYSIGPGLAFLRERTGASKALIVTGWHLAPTSGRTVFDFLMMAPPPEEAGELSVIMADLATGDVEWFRSNQEVYDGLSLALLGQGSKVDNKVVTDPDRAKALFRDLLASYSGTR
jgi:hypothetical protein